MRYILTGTPGSGKTCLLRHLELCGHAVVEEAATDVIALHQALGVAEPWRSPDFIDHIVTLQRRRQLASPTDGITFFDRSPICTLALSRYAGLAPSPSLLAELKRIEHLYSPTVFFVRNQGYVQPTAARRISFEDALTFERIHEDTYREAGFTLVEIPAAPLETRAAAIRSSI
ncbi:AAA family ATPase [Paractinoplanes atraurantiacus]|uniref:Predicted ATPase n=1 Tax=Paractinoplanes atraurantiacus TaxID=1036182 RepID=A0A285J0F4_9ACTN|nr:AAA family ATPase [Actinoplanes atraurantiacus]SNY52826.1 Predicted ATPase [Actinoplanes atraurantiacus]